MARDLAVLTTVVFLTSCGTAANQTFRLIEELMAIQKLSPSERCERIHIDKRENCRQKIIKETDELTKAMKKEN